MGNYLKKNCIGAWAAQFDSNGLLWLSDFNLGGLYKYNLEEKKLEFEYMFNDIEFGQERMHGLMIIKGLDIFLFPMSDKYVRIYNIKSKSETKIQLPEENVNDNIIVNDNDNVWLINNKCYYFDFEIKTFKVDQMLTDLYSGINNVNQKNIRFKASDNVITIWDSDDKELYVYDYIQKKYETIIINNIDEKIMDLYRMKSKYWIILENSHHIYSRELSDDNYIKYYSDNNDYIDNKFNIPFGMLYNLNNKLILSNYYGRYIMVINEDIKKVECVFPDKQNNEITDCLDYGACYYRVLQYNDYIYFIPQRAREILKCDRNLSLIGRYSMQISVNNDFLNKVFKSEENKYGVVNEKKDYLNIIDYINYIIHKEGEKY